jgi:hypothetical protein
MAVNRSMLYSKWTCLKSVTSAEKFLYIYSRLISRTSNSGRLMRIGCWTSNCNYEWKMEYTNAKQTLNIRRLFRVIATKFIRKAQLQSRIESNYKSMKYLLRISPPCLNDSACVCYKQRLCDTRLDRHDSYQGPVSVGTSFRFVTIYCSSLRFFK